ncbi:MAG: hypothetical protein JXA09_17920 [Anaerolineae bacterium]|nr:hypothetical protein [Anaerolineae bacterium]
MARWSRWQRTLYQFVTYVVVASIALPASPLVVQAWGPTPPGAVASPAPLAAPTQGALPAPQAAAAPVAEGAPPARAEAPAIPLPIALPEGLIYDTFDGSLSLSRDEFHLPHGKLALSFARTWSSETGWSHNWNIFYSEQKQFWSAGQTTIAFVAGVIVQFGPNRSIAFSSVGDGTFSGPTGYALTRIGSIYPSYTMRTPDGILYHFDDPSHLHVTKIETTGGQFLTFAYDAPAAPGKASAIRDTYGRSLTLTYDARSRLTAVTEDNGSTSRSASYTYDGSDQLVTATDAGGGVTRYGYQDGVLTSITNPGGAVTTIQYRTLIANDRLRYESDRRRASQVTTASSTYHFSYQLIGTNEDLPAVTDITTVRQVGATGERTTTYEYVSGLLERVIDPAGGELRLDWSPGGELVSIADAQGHATTYAYDEQGHRTAVTDPLGQTTHYTYDPVHGQIASVTDPNGHVTRYTYDALGNLLTQTDPLSNTIRYEWRGDLLIKVTDPVSRTTSFGYGAFDYPEVVTDSLGHTWHIAYDATGNPLTVTDANGAVTRYAYDAMGRVIAITDPLSQTYALEYSALGALVRITDPSGAAARYQYDAAGRRTVVIDPQGGRTAVTYDELGNVTAVTDPAGHTVRYEYDALGLLTRETDALGQSVTYTYDPAGNLATRTDAQGRTVTYTYDAANRLVGIDYPSSPDVTRTYDGAGRLTGEANGAVDLTYSYDAADRLTEVQIAPLAKTIAYSYDGSGRRASMTDPDGGVTTYTYDPAGQLIALTDPLNQTTAFTRDAGGRVTGQTFPNGASIQATLDAIDQVRSVTYRTSGGALLLSRAYTYDRSGNRLSVVDRDGALTTYEYDALDQLIRVTYSDDSATAYAYDAAGNRTTHTSDGEDTAYTYDAANRLLSVDGATYTYNADGGRSTVVDASGTVTYTYNEDHLLTAMQLPSGETVTYSYYPDGRRLSRTDASGTTYFVYDQANVLLEMDAGGNTLARYTSRDVDRWIAQDRGGETTYYLPDAQGSTIGLLDSAGNLAVTYAYEPFGALRAQTGSAANAYLYAGRRYEDGLYYNRARMYDPIAGRFLTRDPAGMPDGPNRYLYALNNPVTLVDPFGMACGEPTSFGDCHSACMKTLNPPPLQVINLTFGMLGTAASRKAVDLGNKILAASTSKDWLAAAYKPKEPWWSSGLSALAGTLGTVLSQGGKGILKVLGGGVVAGPAAVVGAFLAGWGAGTFVGCALSCKLDSSGYDFAINCDDRKPKPKPKDPPKPPNKPGGDHPDENASAASPYLAASASPVYRDQPYVGVLWRGYASEAGALINQAGEMYLPVDADLGPELADTLPVLVIPSGGLYGLSGSSSFRARLAGYVARGGTILSYAQQHGTHFTALPAPAGGDRLGGYGWREDNSCFSTSLYLSNYHPVVSGLTKPTLDAHVDGYFSTLPAGATELLNRMKNGQPGLVVYPYPAPGEGGYVLATAIYDDWGAGNAQSSHDALVLTRDMLSWAYDPAETLPEMGPGAALSLAVTVLNAAAQDASSIEWTVRRPDRTTAHTQTAPLSIPAGGSATPDLSWTLPADAQLGIWWVEYTLRDAAGQAIQRRAVGRRFIVSDPSPITGPGRDLLFSITSPEERYARGTEGTFTFHVYNHSPTPRTVEVRYGLPHHTWESRDSSYGGYDQLHQTLSVPAATGSPAEATFVYTATMFTVDRLWASLWEGEVWRDQAHFAVYSAPSPILSVTPQTEGVYTPGTSVVVTTTLRNLESAPFDGDLGVQVTDPGGLLLYEDSARVAVPAMGAAAHVVTYSLPLDAPVGMYGVRAEAYGDELAGVGVTHFEAQSARLRISVAEPPVYLPDAGSPVTFTLENIGIEDVSTGVLTVTLEDPDATVVYSESQPFALPAGEATELHYAVVANNRYGTYHLAYQASYNARSTSGSLDIPFASIVQVPASTARNRAGYPALLSVRVTNSGRFEQALDVRLHAPDAGYDQVHALDGLSPGEVATDTHTVPLPSGIAAGSHPFTVTVRLSSGSSMESVHAFPVPPSQLAFSVPPTATAGSAIALTLSNVGGAATGAAYDLRVRDGVVFDAIAGTLAGIEVDATEAITYTLNAAAVSGIYFVLGDLTDTTTGAGLHVYEPLEVSGVEAEMTAHTDQESYLAGDPIVAAAHITGTGVPLSGATLTLQVLSPLTQEQWVTHREGDHGLRSNQIVALAVDQENRKWFAFDWYGTSILDDGGTPTDPSDDGWHMVFGTDETSIGPVDTLVFDDAGRAWYATDGGARVLDYGPDLYDASDDVVQRFHSGDGMLHTYANDLAFEGSSLVWVANGSAYYNGGINVLDHKGTLADKEDDDWASYALADAGVNVQDIRGWSVAVDPAGRKWFGFYGIVAVLDDGGDPFDKVGDTWQVFSTTHGLTSGRVADIQIDAQGRKWFLGSGGVSVLDDGGDPFDDGTGDRWASFTSTDHPSLSTTNGLAFDADGSVWIATGSGALHLDYGGDPFDGSGHTWTVHTQADGLVHDGLCGVAIDQGEYPWFGTCTYGASALDDGGTPSVKGDDTWQSYVASDEELVDNNVLSIAIDPLGRKWFGGERTRTYRRAGGISVLDDGGTPLDRSDDAWQTFTQADGLFLISVKAIAVHPNGVKWFAVEDYVGTSSYTHAHGVAALNDGGTLFDKGDDQWQSYTSADYATLSNQAYTVEVGPEGLIWIGTSYGLVVLDPGDLMDKGDDQWGTLDVIDGPGMGGIRDIAFDDQGRMWLACVSGRVSVLDTHGTPFDNSDDDLATYITTYPDEEDWESWENPYAIAIDGNGLKWVGKEDGLWAFDDAGTPFDGTDDAWGYWSTKIFSDLHAAKALVIDEEGRKWVGAAGRGLLVLDDGGTPLDPADDTWREIGLGPEIGDTEIMGALRDADGSLWFATHGAGASVRVLQAGALWETQIPVDVPVGATQVITPVAPIAETGKLYLYAELASTTGQRIARDKRAFYIYDAEVRLAIETDLEIYRPGQPIALTGQVANDSSAALVGQTLIVTQDGVEILNQALPEIPSGGSHPFSVNTTAPGSPGSTSFEASVGAVRVLDAVDVAAPDVHASVDGPALVGSQAFTLTVTLDNAGAIDALVYVEMGGAIETLTIPAGETRYAQHAFQVSGDAVLGVVLSGDLVETLQHAVAFGEDAAMVYAPAALYCAGLREIPYVVTNTGQTEVAFSAQVTLSHDTRSPEVTQLDVYLPISGTVGGSTTYDLAAGAYLLSWTHAYGSGQADFAVGEPDRATVEAVAGPAAGGTAPLTATVTNVGCAPYEGSLALSARSDAGPFYSAEQPVSVAVGESAAYVLDVNTTDLAPGVYTATLALLNLNGTQVHTATVTGTIPGPELAVTALPTQTVLHVDETADFVFAVSNAGEAGDQAHLTFTLGDMEDETQVKWLDAGSSAVFTYSTYIPRDLPAGETLATYALTGTLDPAGARGEMVLVVQGISLTVEAGHDRPAYREGETATVALTVTNAGPIDTGELAAVVAYNEVTQTQAISLTPGAQARLDYTVTAAFNGDPRLFYGIYFAESDRSIVLNTLYLPQLQPAVTLLTDKQVYRPGDTVHATIVTTLTQGTLSVSAPGYAGQAPIVNGGTFAFALPDPLERGTYGISYTTSDSGSAEDGRLRVAPFDVDGPVVFVQEAILEHVPSAPGDLAVLALIVSADRALDVTQSAWLELPDGGTTSPCDQAVHLAPTAGNRLTVTVPLTDAQMGLYVLSWALVQSGTAGDLILATGGEAFDAGPAVLNRVTTDRASYPLADQPVRASLDIYSASGGSVQALLTLDDGPTTAQALTLVEGLQTIPLTLTSPIPPGRRVLTATLTAGGLQAQARTTFDYGADLADLRPSALWVEAGGTVTRSVIARVYNDGATAAAPTNAHFYVGDPAAGGAWIDSVAVPALDPGQEVEIAGVWNIAGKGGEHTLYVVLDPVVEFDVGNNTARGAVVLPRLDAELLISPSVIQAGEEAAVWVGLQNLQAAQVLPVTATVEIRSSHGDVVYRHSWTVTLDPGEKRWLNDAWVTGSGTPSGLYVAVLEAWDSAGAYLLSSVSPSIGQVDRHYIYLPLVVRDD